MTSPILVALDLADEAHHKAMLEKAWQIAQIEDAKLCVVTVIPDYGMSPVGMFFPDGTAKKALEAASHALRACIDTHLSDVPPERVQGMTLRGTAYHEILELTKKLTPSLVVMGAHKPQLGDYLLGPNAARVMRHAQCSVLVLRNLD